MALTTQIKTALDNMSMTDRTLVALYILGVDKPATALSLGQACVKHGWPNLDADALTNEQIALAVLHTLKRQLRHVWVTQATPEIEEAARSAARAEIKATITAALDADKPLAEMPEPVAVTPEPPAVTP